MKDDFSFLQYKNIKDDKITIKVTTEQKKVLKELSKFHNMSLSAYILYLAENDLKFIKNKDKK